jgi:hypothetical protein
MTSKGYLGGFDRASVKWTGCHARVRAARVPLHGTFYVGVEVLHEGKSQQLFQ